MSDKNNKELNQDALEQVSGGDIIDDAVFELVNITNSVMTEVYNEQAKSDARSHNSVALARAALDNGVENPAFELTPGGLFVKTNIDKRPGCPPGPLL